MYGRDANDATWYLLRYATDFAPRTPVPDDVHPPELDPELFYDDARHVLELLPRPPEHAVAPLSGLAVDATGEVYRVDPETRRLVVRRCDGSETIVVCEPGVFADPAGLAFDRRGFLYVADPAARRVVVLQPEDGTVRDVLAGPDLVEPVDVAVSPRGRIYVADRGGDAPEGGRIVAFTARHARAGSFAAQNDAGLPAVPRPIAVMVDADDTLLVADAEHPRLLRFAADGTPLSDVPLVSLARQLGDDDASLAALGDAYRPLRPRFAPGMCPPPAAARDGGARLAEVHRALRIRRLALAHTFTTRGVFVSATLDAGTPETTWHRIDVDADLPPGTAVQVDTATSEFADGKQRDRFLAGTWDGPGPDGSPVKMTAALQEQLVQSPPGRYLRVRVTLLSTGDDTPSVRAIRVLYPRVSYLDALPRVYRRDADGARFLERFLALFERVLTRVEDRYERFSRELNPDAAPPEMIVWLADLIDLAFDPSWPLERRRALVAAAMDLYRRRGTVHGIERYVEIYTGVRPVVLEAFLQRPRRPALLGVAGTVLGCSTEVASVAPDLPPDAALFRDYAHRFTVLVYVDDRCDADLLLPVVDRIVEVNKPAHTIHEVRAITADVRLGLQSHVGLDITLGGAAIPGTPLGGCPAPATSTGPAVLGVDAVLGGRRPMYPRPPGDFEGTS